MAQSLQKDNNIFTLYNTIAEYYDYTGDIYRARAYRTAIKTNSTHLRLIKINDPSFKAYQVLSKVVGAGPTTVKKWIADGCTTLAKLKTKVKQGYNVSTMVTYGLKYYNDFLQPIPRPEVERIGAHILRILGSGMIVGSYRRGAKLLKDIDILTLSSVPIVNTDLIEIVINGNQKQSIIYKRDVARRVDILRTTPDEWVTALFYFTGSKLFNQKIRATAKRQGYLLSEHGLFRGNKRVTVKTERDIFSILGITYIDPTRR